MNNFEKIIADICSKLNITLTYTSDRWVKILEKNHQVCYITGYKFDLNNHGIGSIMDDKGLFYDICKIKNIPIIKHYVIFEDYDKKQVIKYFHNHDDCIIIKGNIGTCGLEVFKVDNEKDLIEKITTLFQSQYSISLCPFYEIKHEYRTIYLNKELRIIYGKEKPNIIGDGIHTVKELAVKYNPYYQDISLNNESYIPKKDELINLNFQFNLSRGAKMFLEIDPDLKKRIVSLSDDVINKLDLSFVSVDIIHTTDDKLLVMEANSGIMMDNYLRFNPQKYSDVYDLYYDAIKIMFNE